ncbi:hypothetical protein GCM10023075_38020 [Streptosporangium album]
MSPAWPTGIVTGNPVGVGAIGADADIVAAGGALEDRRGPPAKKAPAGNKDHPEKGDLTEKVG